MSAQLDLQTCGLRVESCRFEFAQVTTHAPSGFDKDPVKRKKTMTETIELHEAFVSKTQSFKPKVIYRAAVEKTFKQWDNQVHPALRELRRIVLLVK